MQSTLPGNRRRHPHKAHQVHPLTVRHIDSNWFSFSERKFLIFRLPIGLECGRTAAHRKQISCNRLWFRGQDPWTVRIGQPAFWTACWEKKCTMSLIFWKVWRKAFSLKLLVSLILTFGKDGARGEGEGHFTVVPTGVLRQDALQDAIYFLEDMTKSFLILILVGNIGEVFSWHTLFWHKA